MTEATAPQGTTEPTTEPASQPANILQTAAPPPAALPDRIPEKFRVANESGELDLEASTAKLLDSYAYLEKRQGSGLAPPKTVEEYAIDLGRVGMEQAEWDEYVQDPMTAAFMQEAHAAGLNSDQLSFVMGKYFEVAPQLMQSFQELSVDEAMQELRGEWKTDAEFDENVRAAYKAASASGNAERLLEKYGNDPDFIRFAASIGKQMGEDTPPPAMQAVAPADFSVQIGELRDQIAALKPHDPRRQELIAKQTALYERQYGTKPAHGMR